MQFLLGVAILVQAPPNPTNAEVDADGPEDEAHYCDFPLCPCDDNQNRLLAESNAYYAEDIELERRMGW